MFSKSAMGAAGHNKTRRRDWQTGVRQGSHHQIAQRHHAAMASHTSPRDSVIPATLFRYAHAEFRYVKEGLCYAGHTFCYAVKEQERTPRCGHRRERPRSSLATSSSSAINPQHTPLQKGSRFARRKRRSLPLRTAYPSRERVVRRDEHVRLPELTHAAAKTA